LIENSFGAIEAGNQIPPREGVKKTPYGNTGRLYSRLNLHAQITAGSPRLQYCPLKFSSGFLKVQRLHFTDNDHMVACNMLA